MRMQLLFTIVALTAVAFSGCISEDPADNPGATDGSPNQPVQPTPDSTVSKNETEVAESSEPFAFPEDYPVFCDENRQATETPEGGECDFYDEIFHEYTLYEIDTTKIDVIIIPPESPEAQRDIETLRLAVTAWRDGINELGQPWFLEEFQINVYVAGFDDIPEDARNDPEIIVVAAEFNPALLFGIGLAPADFVGAEDPCLDGDSAEFVYESHAHDGMIIQAADCEQGGYTCVAANTNFLRGGAFRMYDLVAHEVGHCLGTGHVGDALDFSAQYVPIYDIMSYQSNATQVHCVSNLNVRSLEGIYAPLFENAPDTVTVLKPGDFLHMHPANYQQVTCANPATASLLPA